MAAAAPAPAGGAAQTIRGPRLADELRAGRAFVHERAVVVGPVDLQGALTVRSLFKCRECTFRGHVAAPDVTFSRTLDLSGSTFAQEVDFRGTTFEAPALFGAALGEPQDGSPQKRPSSFSGRADFSLAVFRDFASFAGAKFATVAAFRDATFGDATFDDVRFAAAAFDGASFRGAALFNDVRFRGQAAFRDTDFRQRTDFSQAVFLAGAVFKRAGFTEGASFLASRFFVSEPSDEAAVFGSVASAGDLDFTFAVFRPMGHASGHSSPIAVFSGLVCGGSLVFRDTEFSEGQTIVMSRLHVEDLVLDVDVVPRIDSKLDREPVLRMIEESAKARGDLGDANDAHYALRVLESENYSPFGHALDYVFYRGLAGYFARPFRPLVALLALASLLSLIRVLRLELKPMSEDARRAQRMWRGMMIRAGAFITGLLDTLSLLGPRRGGADATSPRLAVRIETFAYRALLVCALLGLANSNPTLRQMIDTLF